MTNPVLTRQYAGADVRRLRCIPFPQPRAPDEDGTLTAHKLMALGAYDTDMHILSLLDLQLTTSEAAASTSLTTLASWEHPGGEVTDLHVSRQPSGSVLLLAGSSSGTITRLHMLVPQAPGSLPRDIQLLGGDVQGQQLQPWAHPHDGPVAFVHHNADDNLVLSGGRDGTLWIGDADGAGDGKPWYALDSVSVCVRVFRQASTFPQVYRRSRPVLCRGCVGVPADLCDGCVQRRAVDVGPAGPPDPDRHGTGCVGADGQRSRGWWHGALVSSVRWLRIVDGNRGTRGDCCAWRCNRRSRTWQRRVRLGAWSRCGTCALAGSRCSAVLEGLATCWRCV